MKLHKDFDLIVVVYQFLVQFCNQLFFRPILTVWSEPCLEFCSNCVLNYNLGQLNAKIYFNLKQIQISRQNVIQISFKIKFYTHKNIFVRTRNWQNHHRTKKEMTNIGSADEKIILPPKKGCRTFQSWTFQTQASDPDQIQSYCNWG